MKKIDLHIHTIAQDNNGEPSFDFSIDTLISYVEKRKLDCIAITNHNQFNLPNFIEIKRKLSNIATIFPGIEIDLEGGHMLLISDGSDLNSFETKSQRINEEFQKTRKSLTFEFFHSIFQNLDDYLLIPHYKNKSKALRDETINKFGNSIFAGEVASLKHFEICKKDSSSLVPLVFSDSRMSPELLTHLPMSQTYIDAGEIISLRQLKLCLRDKTKIFIDESKGPNLFQVLDDGTKASTKLTIVMGQRSSGKTFTLDSIYDFFPNLKIKYIRQFELIEMGTEKEKKELFSKMIDSFQESEASHYLAEYKKVIDNVLKIDLEADHINFDEYYSSLLEVAFETERIDVCSRTRIFNEELLILETHKDLDNLIEAVKLLIDNEKYRLLIEEHVPIVQFKSLIMKLIDVSEKIRIENKMKDFANQIIRNTKLELQSQTSAPAIKEFNVIRYLTNQNVVSTFNDISRVLYQDQKIMTPEDLYGFVITKSKRKFKNIDELKKTIRTNAGLADAFKLYENPYEYLLALKEKVPIEQLHKCFVKIEYSLKNIYGSDVSGGERAEFNLLHKIQDAFKYDMLLIDEPESSFDNIFLAINIRAIIKNLADQIPVIVSTHNNTIGASYQPNRIIYTERLITADNRAEYNVYSGGFTDIELTSSSGKTIKNHLVFMNSLEGGEDKYIERKDNIYAAIKNSKQ